MIDKVLTTIVSKLKSKMGLEGGKLNYLQASKEQLGKILCSVSHIMYESMPSLSRESPAAPMLRFRLNFQSNFESSAYPEGVKHLSTILTYLHQNAIFDSQNTPTLPAEILKVSLDQVEAVESDLGLPTITFEVRVLAEAGTMRGEMPNVKLVE